MTTKEKGFKPRKYMEMAIEVMKKSIQEPRLDKIGPKVGTVLIMPDGSVDIAFTRIKKVWIGLEDPDPTVDRKGIKYLQNNGIEVHMFDRDLQQIIEEDIY